MALERDPAYLQRYGMESETIAQLRRAVDAAVRNQIQAGGERATIATVVFMPYRSAMRSPSLVVRTTTT
jgi:hypothetical protein